MSRCTIIHIHSKHNQPHLLQFSMAASQRLPLCGILVYQKESMVKGLHVYKTSWTCVTWEKLLIKREWGTWMMNTLLLWWRMTTLLVMCSAWSPQCPVFFMWQQNNMPHYWNEKVGVGLEVPLVYLYAGSDRMTRKLSRLLAENIPSSRLSRCFSLTLSRQV